MTRSHDASQLLKRSLLGGAVTRSHDAFQLLRRGSLLGGAVTDDIRMNANTKVIVNEGPEMFGTVNHVSSAE